MVLLLALKVFHLVNQLLHLLGMGTKLVIGLTVVLSVVLVVLHPPLPVLVESYHVVHVLGHAVLELGELVLEGGESGTQIAHISEITLTGLEDRICVVCNRFSYEGLHIEVKHGLLKTIACSKQVIDCQGKGLARLLSWLVCASFSQ